MLMSDLSSASDKKNEFESLSNILIKAKDLPVTNKTPQPTKKEQSETNSNTTINKSVNYQMKKKGSVNGQLDLTNFPYKTVRKRDGRIANFDQTLITRAILKAMEAAKEGTASDAWQVTKIVLEKLATTKNGKVLGIEHIQDEVENALILDDYAKTAKSYIIYRNKRAEAREEKKEIPQKVKDLTLESSKYFKNQLAELVYYQFYSRWKPEEGRRETWVETVDRFMDFMKENLADKLTSKEYDEVKESILNQEVCPSMRLLWASGPAARNSHVTAYNCSYIAPTKLQDFGEIMYISMCGTGLGFAAEHENVEQLPQIKKQTGEHIGTHAVEDSKEGWADAFVLGLESWFSGRDIDFDYSQLRPSGARLETMGGRSSGPQPLVDLMVFARDLILARQGRRLRTIDVHDLICKTGEIVVAGGVRRSALISLSDLDDPIMRDAKKGQFYLTEPQRSMANNSAVYEQKPTAEDFLDEWMSLIKSRTGERGIFNRGGLEKQLPKRRWEAIKDQKQIGVNPCGEIMLRSKQFCNLTSIVVRADDTIESLEKKMRIASILGTYQSTLTNFGYLSKEWKENCEAERLLGISITGYYDNDLIRDAWALKRLREVSIDVNREYADRFGVNHSTAITCVKPHGNSSQLLDTASGMHPRYAKYYIRRIRISRTDPLFTTLKDQGVPYHPEVGQAEESAYTFVMEFPVKAPDNAVTNKQVSALDLLDEWKKLKENFTEHNPSVTIYVGEDEWVNVANFLMENWDIVGGMSFLPRSDHAYKLAPYEEIDKEEYEHRTRELGEIDFSKLYSFEHEDNTQGAKELACVSGACEI
jgi:ribonucleoside-triphosphate reductase (thioredoxin)